MAETFTVKCPNCGRALRLKNRARIGKRAKCPKCGEPFTVRVEEPGPPGDEDDFLAGVSSYEEDEPAGGKAPPPVGRYHHRESSLTDKRTRREREARLQTKRGKVTSSGTVHLLLSLIGGVVGAALGAGLWVHIAGVVGHEAGFAAWGVGILAAVGMRLLGNYEGQILGFCAILISVVGILLAKVGVAWSLTSSVLADVPAEQLAIAVIAEDISRTDPPEEDPNANPKPLDVRNFKIQSVFPPAAWDAARDRFKKLSDEEQAAKTKAVKTASDLRDVRKATAIAVFWAGLTIFDSLWCIFAAVVAFVIVTSDFGL